MLSTSLLLLLVKTTLSLLALILGSPGAHGLRVPLPFPRERLLGLGARSGARRFARCCALAPFRVAGRGGRVIGDGGRVVSQPGPSCKHEPIYLLIGWLGTKDHARHLKQVA